LNLFVLHHNQQVKHHDLVVEDYRKYDADELHHENKTLIKERTIFKKGKDLVLLICIVFAFNPIEIGALFAYHSVIS
jgi:hypothetical protein